MTSSDIYSFSAILVVFLLCMAAGTWLAHTLHATENYRPITVLAGLSAAGGLLAALSPLILDFATRGLSALQGGGNWFVDVGQVFVVAIVSIAGPTILFSAIFPYLLRTTAAAPSIGLAVGKLTALNTIGAVAGSLGTGFLLLPFAGVNLSIGLIALIYAMLAAAMLGRVYWRRRDWRSWTGAAACLALAAGVLLLPSLADDIKLNPSIKETLVSLRHGSSGSVAVVRGYGPLDDPKGPGDLYMRLNNTYTLGGLGAYANQQRQGHLGFWLQPEAKDAYFLGLATGVTAGAALYYPVERVMVCELLPEVTTAARSYFSDSVNGLFKDERVRIVNEDGRTCLAALPDRYDVIVSDLFVPTHAGTGSLYTLEHFRTVRERLRDDGVFVQWLPMYQLHEQDFGSIARTMNEAFPQVTVWRGNFSADKPVLALIGQQQGASLDPAAMERALSRLGADKPSEPAIDALLSVKDGDRYAKLKAGDKKYVQSIWPQLKAAAPYSFYVGNLTAQQAEFRQYPLNTSDRPEIEFNAPKRSGSPASRARGSLTGLELIEFLDKKLAVQAMARDPYIRHLTDDQRRYVSAGQDYYSYFVLQYEAYRKNDQQAASLAQYYFGDYLKKTGIPPQKR